MATDACHEGITARAIDAAGWPAGAQPPPHGPHTAQIAKDLPWSAANLLADPWRMALGVGVRFNDLHGSESIDLPQLSLWHNDPMLQAEHCLRAPEHDGEAGDAAALSACRAFILREFVAATGDGTEPGALDERVTRVDLRTLEPVRVALAFVGPRTVDLQRFGFHMGRALHALQDGFSHSFRSPDGQRVRHVLNFAETSSRKYRAQRDGFRHLAALDDCDLGDPLVERNLGLAEEASVALLRAAAPATAVARRTELLRVLDRYLSREPGCSAENQWCAAPEPDIKAARCTAMAGLGRRGIGATSLGWLGPLCLGLALLARRRTRVAGAAWLHAERRRALALACGLAVLAWARVVGADDGLSRRAAGEHGTAFWRAAPPRAAWSLAAGGAGSIDRGGLALRAGLLWQPWQRLGLSLHVEHNPWFSLEAQRAARGAFNTYSGAHLAWLQVGRLGLHSRVYAGASVLLFDLVSMPRGTTGLYLGGTLLGLTWRMAPQWSLQIDPMEVALPMPQLRGIPFYYLQYRLAFGVQWHL